MDDPQSVTAWLGRWWTEAVLGAVALAGVVTGVRDGQPLRIVVAVALAAAVVDRVRLRMDNRSLSLAVTEVRDGRVSAVRRGDGTLAGGESAAPDEGPEDGADGAAATGDDAEGTAAGRG